MVVGDVCHGRSVLWKEWVWKKRAVKEMGLASHDFPFLFWLDHTLLLVLIRYPLNHLDWIHIIWSSTYTFTFLTRGYSETAVSHPWIING